MPEGGTMKDDELDRVLSMQDELQPSSGFAASVMEAVRREAAAPPPIPFPWKRAWPGLVVAGLALVVLVAVEVLQPSRGLIHPQFSMSLPSLLTPISGGTGSGWPRSLESAMIWTGLALAGAWATVKVTMRLASGS